MKKYNYTKLTEISVDLEILNLISTIHEYKGRQELYLETRPQTLERLQEISIIQSTDASNRIEGIWTSNKRLRELVEEKSEPRNRNEQEILGYREALALVHERYEYIRLTKNDILTLHNRLYSYYPNRGRGKYKQTENVIAEKNEKGEEKIRFIPVSPLLVEENMERMLAEIENVKRKKEVDPLLYIPHFILDFLCIHPFNDGNGRMARLLTLLLLYQSGYLVGKYISIEMIIEKTKGEYYDTLQKSSVGWHEGENNPIPFVKYMLGVILKAYEIFNERHEGLLDDEKTSAERIYGLIQRSVEPLSKAEIVLLCPEVSQKTVERALNKLKNDEKIVMVGRGRNTRYVRK